MALIASRGIGNAGTMEIHDDGWTVLMRIRSSDGATYSGAIPIRVYINGGWSGWFTVNYPSGSPWVNVWSGGIGSSQSVAFQVGDTGTSGFGGGGDLWGAISRATVPPAPDTASPGLGLDLITSTGMRFRFSSRGTGGATFLRWEYQCWPDPAFTGAGVATSSGTTVRDDLAPGTKYYWRARGVNTVGTGPWSATVSATTLAQGFQGGKGGSFVPFPTKVGKSSGFVDVPIFIGKGGSFVPLG